MVNQTSQSETLRELEAEVLKTIESAKFDGLQNFRPYLDFVVDLFTAARQRLGIDGQAEDCGEMPHGKDE